jgi:hypothetical protein
MNANNLRVLYTSAHLRRNSARKKYNKMKRVLAIVLCMAMPVGIFAADNGYKVTYDGGPIPDLHTYLCA